MKIGIQILNYNGMRWLPALLKSLKQEAFPGQRIYVVDNASSDESLQYVAQEHPDVTIIRHAENLGYSMAYNLAIKTALSDGCEWMCLLNSDTIVLPGWLDGMAEAAADPSVGVMGPVQWAWDRDEPNHFMNRYDAAKYLGDDCAPFDCDWVEGSCLCVRRECFEDVGPLDPSYYFFWEDADYCRRAGYHGWRVVVVPESKIRHFGGGSSGGEYRSRLDRLGRLRVRNYYRFKLSDPNRQFILNLAAALRLFLTQQKQALLDRKSLPLACQHLWEFTRSLLATPSFFAKWRRDRAKCHPPELTAEFEYLRDGKTSFAGVTLRGRAA